MRTLPLSPPKRHLGGRCGSWTKLAAAIVPAMLLSAFVSPLARAETPTSVAVIVVSPFDPSAYASRGAVGLIVPGAGATVSRERARASLLRGSVVSSLVGLTGKPVIHLSTTPATTTIYVSLPPPGTHHNVKRYPVAIVGPGWHGLLTSPSTRIPGLVSLADIAPTANAIARGAATPIRARPDAQVPVTLARLDRRLARAHGARTGATLVLVGWLVAFSSFGILGRSALAGRAALLAGPVALVTAVLFRGAGIDDPTTVVALLGVVVGAASLALALRRQLAPYAIVALLVVFLVVLVAWPDVNALAAIGPHPDGGGRFYGVTNEVETLLLAPALAAGAALGTGAAVAVGLLLLVTVGWSRAGADGGGIAVVGAAWAVLLALLARLRLTPARVVLGVLGVVVAGLVLVGLDAATGGSSHVTHAVGGGPGALWDDLSRRLQISWHGATRAAHVAFLCLLSIGGLVWLGIRGRRNATVPALIAGLAVSLVVNDTPVDVLGYGALGALALTAWEETRARDPVRTPRSAVPSAPREPQEHPARSA